MWDLKGLDKDFDFIPKARERMIQQGVPLTERLRLSELLLFTLKDPMIFWERHKVCYCSQGNNKWNDRTGPQDSS